MLPKAALLLVVGLLVPADRAKTDQAKDTDKGVKALQGKWTVVAGEEGGKKQTDAQLKDSWVEFSGTRVRVHSPREELSMTYTARPDHKPAHIDFTVTAGPDKGKTSKGIYRLEGDTLKIAYAAPEKERPKHFATAEGSHQSMWVLKRATGSGK